jgi:transposase-like protein
MIASMAQIAPRAISLDVHRMKLSPESQARVIHLLFVNELSVDIVAQRMGVGKSTIRRIQMAHCEKVDARKHLDNGDRR